MTDILEVVFSVIATGISLTPIVLIPATGEIVDQLAGVMNIGNEGMMLFGAIVGYFVMLATGSVPLALLAAAGIGALVAAFTAFFVVRLGLNQVVFGLGVFLLGSAVSSVLYIHFAAATRPVIQLMPKLVIPILSSIPYVGLIFEQNALVYVTLLIVLIVWFVLDRTWLGLKIRAVGQDAAVADSLGLNVQRYRFAGLLVSGVFSALGGIYIILAVTGIFVDNVTAGAGFIAVGVLRVGSWSPWRALLACLAYSIINGLQYTLQFLAAGISPQLFQAIPYLVVILLLALPRSKERQPRSLGIPYKRE